SARNLRSYFRAPSETLGNADGIGVSRGSVENPRRARRERKGTKNRRTPPKTGENTGDDSPSVRRHRGGRGMTKRWRDVLQIHPAAELFPPMTSTIQSVMDGKHIL